MTKEIQKNIDYTLSTFAIEKLKPSKVAIELCRKNAEGSISLENAIQEIKNRYKVARI
jgi:hypothetical protein